MALSTYSDLQASVALWTNRNDLTTVIPDFVLLCEEDLNRRLRTPWNETMDTAFAVSSRYTALPSDFQEMRRVFLLDGSVRTELVPLPQAGSVNDSGVPAFYNIVDNQLEVVPYGSYTLEITYYNTVPALASNSTTDVLTKFPSVYLYGTCLQAGLFLDDASLVSKFMPAYEKALILANSSRKQLGTGLQVRAR